MSEGAREEGWVVRRVASGGGGGTEVGMWVGGGGAIYWAKDGYGTRSKRSLAKKYFPSDGASLGFILILALSKRCGFISAQEKFAHGLPIWG